MLFARTASLHGITKLTSLASLAGPRRRACHYASGSSAVSAVFVLRAKHRTRVLVVVASAVRLGASLYQNRIYHGFAGTRNGEFRSLKPGALHCGTV